MNIALVWHSIFLLTDGNGFGKNVIIFDADMSSAGHAHNSKKDIITVGKGPTQGLKDTTLTAKKQHAINFSEQEKKFCLHLHYNGVNSYLLFNGVDI